MPNTPLTPPARDALSFRIGRWAEANATGLGLAALVAIVLLGAAAALIAGPILLAH